MNVKDPRMAELFDIVRPWASYTGPCAVRDDAPEYVKAAAKELYSICWDFDRGQ